MSEVLDLDILLFCFCAERRCRFQWVSYVKKIIADNKHCGTILDFVTRGWRHCDCRGKPIEFSCRPSVATAFAFLVAAVPRLAAATSCCCCRPAVATVALRLVSLLFTCDRSYLVRACVRACVAYPYYYQYLRRPVVRGHFVVRRREPLSSSSVAHNNNRPTLSSSSSSSATDRVYNRRFFTFSVRRPCLPVPSSSAVRSQRETWRAPRWNDRWISNPPCAGRPRDKGARLWVCRRPARHRTAPGPSMCRRILAVTSCRKSPQVNQTRFGCYYTGTVTSPSRDRPFFFPPRNKMCPRRRL